MKLASLKSGRDGRLVVVSRDLTRACDASGVAATLQAALDDWARCEPLLRALSERLAQGGGDSFAFDVSQAAAPMPRAYHWCDGSAYLSHAELVRKARNADMPQSLYSDPLIYQGGSDILLGAQDPIIAKDEAWGIDLEAEIVVVTDDVPMGVSKADAKAHIKLVGLINDVSLRNLIPGELAKGFGFYQSKPPTVFAPVMVTPDELGDDWKGAHLALPVVSHVNGVELGHPDAGADLYFDFAQLIAHVAYTRPLGAGTIVGSGTVSNRDMSVGSSCLAERRMIEIIDTGKPVTSFLKFGDRVRIEVLDKTGASVFGAIDQQVVSA